MNGRLRLYGARGRRCFYTLVIWFAVAACLCAEAGTSGALPTTTAFVLLGSLVGCLTKASETHKQRLRQIATEALAAQPGAGGAALAEAFLAGRRRELRFDALFFGLLAALSAALAALLVYAGAKPLSLECSTRSWPGPGGWSI